MQKNWDKFQKFNFNKDDLFKTMYDLIPSGIVIIDDNNYIRFVNQRACKITEYSKEELEGHHCEIIFPKQSLSKESSIWKDNLQEFHGMESYVTCKSGRKNLVLTSVKKISLDGENFIMEIMQDFKFKKQSYLDLENSEEEYRTLFNTANDAIIIFQPDDEVILNANEKACELYKMTKKELIGKSLKEFTVDRKKSGEEISATLIKKKKYNFITRQKIKNGKIIELDVNASILTYKGKLAILSINRDITKQRKLEQILIESETKFKKMYENTLVGIARIDSNYRILEANKAYCAMLGYQENKLIGENLKDITHPESIEKNLELQSKLGNGEIDHFEIEKKFLHKSGKTIYGILNAVAIRDDKSNLSYFLENVLDITSRKKSETAIKDLSLRLSLAVKSANIGIWDLNLENKQLIWDENMYKLYGILKENSSCSFEAWEKTVHPDDLIFLEKKIQDAINGINELDTSFRILTPDKKIRYIKAHAKIMYNKDNHPIRMVGVNYDITKMILQQQKIQNNLNEKIVLLQEIHHRVKNNMQIIISLLRLQSSTMTDSVAKDALMNSQNRIRSMALVHDKLYRSDNFIDINLKKYITSLIGDLIRSSSNKPNDFKINTDMEDIALPIDKAIPCGLIINELITFSLKYAINDKLTPEINLTFKTNKYKQAELTYRDNGSSISKNVNLKNPNDLGFQLIMVLAKGQLKGEIKVKTFGGFGFSVRFNV